MGAAIAASVMEIDTAKDQYHSPPSGRPAAMLFTKKHAENHRHHHRGESGIREVIEHPANGAFTQFQAVTSIRSNLCKLGHSRQSSSLGLAMNIW